MANNIIISVIIPVYNAGDYIKKCLISVSTQCFCDMEIIVIDDGSTDATPKLCDGFADMDSRIRVIHQNNQGAVVSRKNGLSMARGRYVCFVDADDWIEQDMLRTLYQLAMEADADIVISGTYLDRNGSSSIDPTRCMAPGIYYQGDSAIIHNMIYSDDYKSRGVSSSLWNKLFRRDLVYDVFSQINDNTRFSEDEICVYSCILKAKTIVVTDKVFYHYCRNNQSLTMSSDEHYFYYADLFYNQMKDVFADSGSRSLLMDKLNRYMIEVYSKGINKYKGLNFGNIISLMYPDLTGIVKIPIYNVVLYGASDVGQSYYRWLCQNPFVKVVAWTDKYWNEYVKNGMGLDDIGCLTKKQFDYLIICVESEGLSEIIRKELAANYAIDPKKIYWRRPIRLVETI